MHQCINQYVPSFSWSVFMYSGKATRISSQPHHNQCDGLWQTCFFVSSTLCCLTKWIKTGWHLYFFSCMHFVKCTFSTKLTCNHSTKKQAVVPNVVLCVECSSLRPLSLWPCTWTLTVLLPPGKPCWCMWLCFIPTTVDCSGLKLVQVWACRVRRLLTLWCSCLSDSHFACFCIRIFVLVHNLLFTFPRRIMKVYFYDHSTETKPTNTFCSVVSAAL